MKRSLVLIAVYLGTLVFITALIALSFVLFPGSPAPTSYVGKAVRVADIFVYSFFSLLPFTAVFSLLAVILHCIKTDSVGALDFLTYVFLCCCAWLLIIPFCFLYHPEQRLCFFITGRAVSPAAAFFNEGLTAAFFNSFEARYFTPPDILILIFNTLFFVGKLLKTAVAAGRTSYVLFASAGLAMSALYGLHSVSHWKLINAFFVITLWFALGALNVYMYMPNFLFIFAGRWQPLIINGALCFLLCVISLVSAARRAKYTGVEQ